VTSNEIIPLKPYRDEELVSLGLFKSEVQLKRARRNGDAPPAARLHYREHITMGSAILEWLEARTHASLAAELAAEPNKFAKARASVARATKARLGSVRARKAQAARLTGEEGLDNASKGDHCPTRPPR
jgi:hypothetical protein